MTWCWHPHESLSCITTIVPVLMVFAFCPLLRVEKEMDWGTFFFFKSSLFWILIGWLIVKQKGVPTSEWLTWFSCVWVKVMFLSFKTSGSAVMVNGVCMVKDETSEVTWVRFRFLGARWDALWVAVWRDRSWGLARAVQGCTVWQTQCLSQQLVILCRLCVAPSDMLA